MQKIENNKTPSHHPQINTRYDLGNPIREKTQLEGEVALLSFLWYGNCWAHAYFGKKVYFGRRIIFGRNIGFGRHLFQIYETKIYVS